MTTVKRWMGHGARRLAAPLAILAAAVPAGAQDVGNGGAGTAVAADRSAMPVPFGPGEDMRYKVRLGVVPVGEGRMTVQGIDTVRGFPSYRLRVGMEASAFLGTLKLNDTYESWLDTEMLVSRRFVRDVDQPGYQSRREFEIYPEEGRWERTDADKAGEGPLLALDEISFLYFIRTLPLEVGDTYEFNRYFKDDGNPVVVRVLRRERVEVPAGTFDAVVVQPVIQTDGLFSEGGEAEVFFTDDEDRHLIYLRSKLPLVGSLSLHLESVQKGTPVHPDAR